MLGRIKKEKISVGIDLGSQKIKVCFVKPKEGADLNILGVYENKTYGFEDGAVSDLGMFSECVHQAVAGLMKKTQCKVKEVCLGVSSELVALRETQTAIPLVDKGSKIIGSRDIKKVNNQARLLGLKMEEEVLHDLPQTYQVDDNPPAVNPLGLYGRKFGVRSLMFIANVNRLRNITKAVNQAGFDVSHLYFSSYVASKATVEESDRIKGCVVVDCGAKTTNLFIFKDNILKFYHKFDRGGKHITQAIAHQLNLSFDLAEEIKKSYASAIATEQMFDEEILVKKESSYFPIKRAVIFRAIEPEVEHLVQDIFMAFKTSGWHDNVQSGMTFVGGGSLLPGLMERVSQVANISTRLGKMPLGASRSLDKSAMYSSAVSLAKKNWENSQRFSFSSNNGVTWNKQLASRVKELYQEYF